MPVIAGIADQSRGVEQVESHVRSNHPADDGNLTVERDFRIPECDSVGCGDDIRAEIWDGDHQ